MDNFIDLHAHSTLKLYYFPHIKNFKSKIPAGPFFNPLGFRTSYKILKKSDIKIMINAHYVIEKNFLKYGFKKPLFSTLKITAYPIIKKILSEDPFEALLNQLDLLEDEIKKIKYKKGEKKLKIIRSLNELNSLGKNEIGIIHAIEGAHALGEKKDEESRQEFLKRIEERIKYLKKRGVLMIGISHFWDNPFMPQTDGTEIIAQKQKGRIIPRRNDFAFKMKRAEWKYGDSNYFSIEFIKMLIENNILIDLVHTQEHARNEIYKIALKNNIPLVVSHVGLKHFFEHEYNLSDEEILNIHKTQGIIGLIFSKRWLTAPINRYKNKGGIKELIENIKYIKKLTGDISIVGLGTDFDGFTTPFKDCYNHIGIKKLINAMEKEFDEKEIKNILYGNALRVIKKGLFPKNS